MKKLFRAPLLMAVFLAAIFASCQKPQLNSITKEDTNYIQVSAFSRIYNVEVDSCEYLVANSPDGISIIHKENCKNHKK